MKNLNLFPDSRLPVLAELGIFLFPLAPGWGAIFVGIQLIRSTKHFYKQILQERVAWLLGGISLWLFFVTAISPYPLDSFLGMANFLPFFLFFLTFSYLLDRVDRLERMAWLFVVPSSVVALLGLADIWLGWKTPDFIWSLFGWALTGVGNPAGRVASTFMYANICAAYLLMCFLLGLGLWLKDFRWQKFTQSKLFLYLTFTLVIDFVALILTNSRNVWAIAFLGILIYAIYIGWWWICAFAGGFFAAVLGASFGQPPWRDGLRRVIPFYFWGRLSDQMFAGDRPVADLRSTQWQFLGDMIQRRPITGFGLRSFTPAYETAMETWLGHPHNLYLMLTSEMGIPAAGLLIGLIGWVLAQGVFTWQSLTEKPEKLIMFSYLMAFGGYTLFNLLDVTVLDLRLNTFAWLLLAGIWGLGKQVNQPRNESQGHSHPEQT
ncbi:O-antigen polymerase [[Leptolyngbya] sp. PCC 7376]|uniref:O-antigen ligase family protein n=1 Tax=[Leptolyngbya] sp. PCC 7376 TaxID=111781 RepID=UPI00029F4AE1|nr:O-antigen ligase family protein [[Leptolyngbya] sp. PCC 7376]AFY40301.1 O-antigen polymerase [[Leptolyngbya] sp. PCC 7376]